MPIRHFVSYSRADGQEFADRLVAALAGQKPPIEVWLDRPEIHGGQEWAEVVAEGIEESATLVFVMTRDSVSRHSGCKNEYIHALNHRKPVIPVRLHPQASLPLRLNSLDYIPFDDFDVGLRDLLRALEFRTSPEGVLYSLKDAFLDAERRKARAGSDGERIAIDREIAQIESEIEAQRQVVDQRRPQTRRRTPSDQAVAALEAEMPRWIERILAVQDPGSGGIRGQIYDPTTPPQSWTTAQSLAGMLATPHARRYREEIRAAFAYLEDNRQRGEIEGWSLYDHGGDSITEIGGWIALAEIRALDAGFVWHRSEVDEIARRVRRDLEWLVSRQHASGGWCPTRQLTRRNTRTYSTVMALLSLIEAARSAAIEIDPDWPVLIDGGLRWLLSERSPDLGWLANPNRRMQRDGNLGIEAQVLALLGFAERGESADRRSVLGGNEILKRAREEFLDNEDFDSRRLFLNDALADADQRLQETSLHLEGSSFLWAPWSVAALDELSRSAAGGPGAGAAGKAKLGLMARIYDRREKLGYPGTYELAEFLFCLAKVLYPRTP